MSGQDGGITLEGLAERLGALERENEALRNEVAELRGSGARAGGELAVDPGVRVSRRQLLRNAGAAAVAAVATGTLLNAREAKADHFAPGIEVDYIFAHSNSRSAVVGISEGPNGIFGVYGRAERPGFASVYGQNTNIDGVGVRGQSLDGIGVKGTGAAGVHGESSTNKRGAVEGSNTAAEGYGVWGNANFMGVRGTGGTYGVFGDCPTAGAIGVVGRNNAENSTGVFGEAAAGRGVQGFGRTGVLGESPDSNGRGVSGESQRGTGVLGTGRTGVAGISTGTGYAGYFEGGKAQLRIMPDLESGRPTTGSHFKGEIYMDTAGTLFVCTGTGIPGTWRRFATVAT